MDLVSQHATHAAPTPRKFSRMSFRRPALAGLVVWSLGLAWLPALSHAGQATSGQAMPAAAGTADSATMGMNAYQIGPEDVLSISIWKTPDLTQEETVRPDGRIGLKLIGEVPAAGMTIATLRQFLTEKYRDFVPEAEVSVSLKEMNSFKVYLLGKVSKPGEYRVKSQLTVLQALAMAGGFTAYANERGVKILRHQGGQDLMLSFDYREVMQGKAPDPRLQPGDRLLVP